MPASRTGVPQSASDLRYGAGDRSSPWWPAPRPRRRRHRARGASPHLAHLATVLWSALGYEAAYVATWLGGIGISLAILWPILTRLFADLPYLLGVL